MAVERRRSAGRLTGWAAVRAGRGGAELPGSFADAGADLGRPGPADDPQREDPAVVERDAIADALAGTAHALRGVAGSRGGYRSDGAGIDAGNSCHTGAAGAHENRRQ